jgi:hypothetical protein
MHIIGSIVGQKSRTRAPVCDPGTSIVHDESGLLAAVANGQPPLAFIADEKPFNQLGGIGPPVGKAGSSIRKNIRIHLPTIHRIDTPLGGRIAGQQFSRQKPLQFRFHKVRYRSLLPRSSDNVIQPGF